MVMTVHGTVMYWIIGINIALMIALILRNISALPAKIPLTFNSKGEIKGIYSKYFLWIPLALNICLAIHSFFTTINIPILNIEIMLTTTIFMLNNTLFSIFLIYLTFSIIKISKNKINKLPKNVMIYSTYLIIIMVCLCIISIRIAFFDGK